MRLFFLRLILLAGLSTSLSAADLVDIYHQALEYDPTFKAAYSTFMASKEATPQAQASLLPQVTLSGQMARNDMRVLAGTLYVRQLFNSNQLQLTASQTIFNGKVWAQVQQAKASVKAAHATFNNAAQELILRTSRAYFEVLFAQDTLNFAEAKLRANKRQLEQAQQRFEVGVDTITSVYEAQAGYDQSVAEVIAAKNNQINQNENLRKLTNHVHDYLAPLRNSRIPLIRPEPEDADTWISTGLRQNYNLHAAKYSLQASRENLKAQSMGHLPTLTLEGVNTELRNSVPTVASNFFVPAYQRYSGVSLTVNYQLYQGGLVNSQTRQAQYDFQTTSEKVEQIHRDVVVNSRIAYNTIIDGISKVKADRQTVISQKNSLESTEAQFQAGTRTMVDVVNAQRRLFEAQQQLAQGQYRLINSLLELKYLAGSLNVTDLAEVNAWLKTTRIAALPPQNQKIH